MPRLEQVHISGSFKPDSEILHAFLMNMINQSIFFN